MMPRKPVLALLKKTLVKQVIFQKKAGGHDSNPAGIVIWMRMLKQTLNRKVEPVAVTPVGFTQTVENKTKFMLKIYYFVALLIVSLFLVACDNLDPESIRKRQHLPGKDFVANVQLGETQFAENCARCHGPAGTGTQQGPPLVDEVYRASHHADITFHWAVKGGVKQHHWKYGDMPPVKNVSPEAVGHIIAYIRQQQRISGIK